MSEIDHLLPPNATALERALSIVDGERLALFPPQALSRLLDPQTCPAAFLPALAFELSVEEEWDLAVTEQQQRDLLANAYALNARKGTPFAIKRGLAAIGFPGATLVEGLPEVLHDRTILRRNGRYRYNSPARWALFDVHIPRGADQPFQAAEYARALRGIEIWQRAACYLNAVRVTVAPNVVRGTDATVRAVVRPRFVLRARRDQVRDGRFTRGGARRFLYDGIDLHDGVPLRDGSVFREPAIRFGPPRLAWIKAVRLVLTVRRPTTLRFDGSVVRDGSLPRGFNGARARLNPRGFDSGFSKGFA